ncbi:hypothetical protein KDK95_04385 [Actinospica sp. MGRD01-02]|uniref:Uncharacterized protein n=1 Tax=Actinospica acidithermotolerans TaxID=2828514 RepID=A0A941E826_9ACTN|nr:hypothetical protein [Actinospica acidithermotolerans]MBR7825532.1 hypothetical protein [Actinospica acidithermotolerans]
MTTRAGWQLRGARAAVFAAVCVGVSVAGHVWMSGDAIPLWAVALAFAALTASGYALAGRRPRGVLSISALMLLGELGQHYLFAAVQSAATAPAMPAPAASEFVSGRVLPASAWICGMPASGMRHGGIGMIAAHVGAGLLSAWWLRNGDAAVFQLVQTLGVLAAPLLLLIWPDTLVVPDFRRPALAADAHVRARCTRLLSTVVARRGPPFSRICAI